MFRPKWWHYLVGFGLLFLMGVMIWNWIPQASMPDSPPVSTSPGVYDYPPDADFPPPVSGRARANPPSGYAFSDLVAQLKAGEVESITIIGSAVSVKLIEGPTYRISWPFGDIIGNLRAFGVTEEQLAAVRIDYVSPPPAWLGSLMIGLLMLVILFLIFRRSARAGGGGAGSPFGSMGLTASRAKMAKPDQSKVTFEDVAGCEEAKEDLREVVEFLKHPEKFVSLGARIPKGAILFGPPGCGKTLLARAVAGEAGVPFFSIAGSQFVEVFVGVGASRVRELFDNAKKNAPCIVFVDEIDGVGGQRVPGGLGGGQEHNQTLNELLSQMDGFDQTTNVVVLAATNRPEILDAALLRSGCLDRGVAVDRPDIKAREKIFAVHVRGKPLAEDVSFQKLAKATPGLTGADIENAVNEAAILAVKRSKSVIGMVELYEGIEKSALGPERRSRAISKAEKRTIAYHEAGHAIAMHFTEGSDPVHKISIISRGFGLGYTMPLPEEDRNLVSRRWLEGQIVGLLGGRAAEELIFGEGEVTTGASNDLQRATDYARRMASEWGMSDEVGLLNLASLPGSSLTEMQMRGERAFSEHLAQTIDREMQRILAEAYAQAQKIITDHRNILEKVVARLIEVETIEREEFLELVSNGS
uniref:ATP-dependent zinc metalloprotease FtsH n=1 Tax=candidate division WWE3 bacterium TaxID=2053526 RepID=A0A831YQ92_UNCKA